jgi:hypothetical protein
VSERVSLDELNDLESSLSLSSVRQWLAAERWSLTQEKPGVAELWSRPDGENLGHIYNVLLPIATSYADFGRRFKTLLADLGRAYELSLPDLAQEIASVSTDIFFVRLDQTSSDGTIPFKQATALLASIQKMVRAAATTTANPLHSHTGRRPAAVNEFLEDDLRFGHTKRGSFIITVAARLDPAELTVKPLGEQVGDLPVDPQIAGEIKPFSRRVMETLATGLLATKHQLAEGSDPAQYTDFETARSEGMSLELVQSLIEVSDVEGLRSVDLSFQWATAGPTPPAIETDMSINAGELPRLEVVRDKLILKEEPQEQTLIGRVSDLSRDEIGGGEEETSILLEAEINGGLKKIRVPLNPAEYEWAIFAHQRRLPLTVTGVPVRRGRWVMEGVISVDTRFLQTVRNDEQQSGRNVPSIASGPTVVEGENAGATPDIPPAPAF